MFKEILQAVEKTNKKLTIEKQYLNYQTFEEVLCKNPRVLVIMCHGKLKKDAKGGESGVFCLEDKEDPFLIDDYDESSLLTILKDKKDINIDVIILSTCHSERLGKILANNIKPSPAVIAINTTD